MAGGTSTQKTQQQQNSSTEPWQNALPQLNGILGGISEGVNNYQPTGAEQGALGTLMSNAQATPNYAPQAMSLANDLMGGGTNYGGMINDAYKQYQQQLSPYANGQNLDPTQAPGMAQLLETIRGDVGNSVNGMFAGAGRDLSGYNQQTLARGIAQGEAAPLLAQYNQNVQNQLGAAGNLFNAGGQTASALTGFDQQGYANRAQGLDYGINGVPQAQNAQAQNVLGAAQTARNLPLNNLGLLENLTVPIAGLGSQKTGTQTGTAESTMSPAQQAWGWMGAGGNLFGKFFPGGV